MRALPGEHIALSRSSRVFLLSLSFALLRDVLHANVCKCKDSHVQGFASILIPPSRTLPHSGNPHSILTRVRMKTDWVLSYCRYLLTATITPCFNRYNETTKRFDTANRGNSIWISADGATSLTTVTAKTAGRAPKSTPTTAKLNGHRAIGAMATLIYSVSNGAKSIGAERITFATNAKTSWAINWSSLYASLAHKPTETEWRYLKWLANSTVICADANTASTATPTNSKQINQTDWNRNHENHNYI